MCDVLLCLCCVLCCCCCLLFDVCVCFCIVFALLWFCSVFGLKTQESTRNPKRPQEKPISQISKGRTTSANKQTTTCHRITKISSIIKYIFNHLLSFRCLYKSYEYAYQASYIHILYAINAYLNSLNFYYFIRSSNFY